MPDLPTGEAREKIMEMASRESAKVWMEFPGGVDAAERELTRRALHGDAAGLLPPEYWAKVLEHFQALKNAK